MVDQAASNIANDMPVDHVDRNLAALLACEVDEVAAAYAGTVDPAGLTLVAVGDAETVVPVLRGIGHAEVEVVQA